MAGEDDDEHDVTHEADPQPVEAQADVGDLSPSEAGHYIAKVQKAQGAGTFANLPGEG